MKQLRIILILIVMIVIVVFSIQNAELVELRLMGFSGEISKTVLMLLCFTAGSIVTIVALLPGVFKKKKLQEEATATEQDALSEQKESAE